MTMMLEGVGFFVLASIFCFVLIYAATKWPSLAAALIVVLVVFGTSYLQGVLVS